MTVLRLILLFQLFTIYPLIALIWRGSAAYVFNFGEPENSIPKKMLYNFCVVGICVLLGIFLPSIGLVITVFGSICGFILIFLAPTVCDYRIMVKEGQYRKKTLCFYVVIIIAGLLNCIMNNYHFFDTLIRSDATNP